MSIRCEESLASLIAGSGLIWAASVATSSALPVYAVELTVGPLETCAIAILIWLHAKYRRTLHAQMAPCLHQRFPTSS